MLYLQVDGAVLYLPVMSVTWLMICFGTAFWFYYFILDCFLNILSFWDVKLRLQIFWYIVDLWWCTVPAFFTLSILHGNADYHICENCSVTLSYYWRYCSRYLENYHVLHAWKSFRGDLYQWPVSHFLLASSIQYCSICRFVLSLSLSQRTFSGSKFLGYED